MRMINRLLALLMALLMLALPALAENAGEDVLATVNGTPVTREAFDTHLSALTQYYAYYGYDVTTPENASYLQYMALSILVQQTLMDQKLIEMNVTLTDAERAAAEEEGRRLWLTDLDNALSYSGVTDASSEAERAAALVQALSELEALGYTEQTYIDDSLANALYIKLEGMMVEGASVPEGEVEGRYEDLVSADRTRYADDAAAYESAQQMNAIALMYGMTDLYTDIWYIPEGYRTMVHILLPVDDALLTAWGDLQATWEEQQSTLEEGGTLTGEAVTEEQLESARLAALASVQPQLDEISDRLSAGEAFVDLIPLYTADTAMDEASELAAGYQVHMDSIFCPPGYRDAAFTLDNPGDVSEAFVADGGVYLVCYVGDAEGGPIPLTTELHAALYAQLLEEAQNTKYQETLAAWESAAEIVYSDEALALLNGR